jgi:hypothetical protein
MTEKLQEKNELFSSQISTLREELTESQNRRIELRKQKKQKKKELRKEQRKNNQISSEESISHLQKSNDGNHGRENRESKVHKQEGQLSKSHYDLLQSQTRDNFMNQSLKGHLKNDGNPGAKTISSKIKDDESKNLTSAIKPSSTVQTNQLPIATLDKQNLHVLPKDFKVKFSKSRTQNSMNPEVKNYKVKITNDDVPPCISEGRNSKPLSGERAKSDNKIGTSKNAADVEDISLFGDAIEKFDHDKFVRDVERIEGTDSSLQVNPSTRYHLLDGERVLLSNEEKIKERYNSYINGSESAESESGEEEIADHVGLLHPGTKHAHQLF